MCKWSKPAPYDLTRATRRVSVPAACAVVVPQAAGAYVIYRAGRRTAGEAILDIGECGPRERCFPRGLRGRLASTCPHSASERIAADLRSGKLQGDLCVTWLTADSKEFAKSLQDALISLFRREFDRQPCYNKKVESSPAPEFCEELYAAVKALVVAA